MRAHTLLVTTAALGFLAATPRGSAAPRWSTIANIPGGPQIGAVSGTTLYGTLPNSGAGVLFSLTEGGTYTPLHDFDAGTDGQNPNARLVLDQSGNIFGAASNGGAAGDGTVWEYTAGALHAVHSFGVADGDGTHPFQGPTLAPNGRMIDTTSQGAIGGSGNIFAVTPHDAYRVLYRFQSMGDGHCPFSGVAIGRNGALYGTTVGVGYGGNPTGSIWRFTAKAGLKTLYVFQNGADGEWPDQAPTLDSAGNLYGTTHIQNGNGFAGAIWKVTAKGVFSILHVMNAATDGYGPNSPLLLAADGLLYGTAASGGANNDGTLFSITTGGTFTTIHSFAAGADGAQPTGNLVQDAAGRIYGGTVSGPVFQFTPE